MAEALSGQSQEVVVDEWTCMPCAGVPAPPRAPVGLVAKPVDGSDWVRLTWRAVTEDTLGEPVFPLMYRVERAPTPEFTFPEEIANTTDTTCIDITAGLLERRFYRVIAVELPWR